MHTSRSVLLLSGILAGDAMDEHGRARPPARSHAFCHTYIQTNAAQGHDNAAAQSHGNAITQGHCNAATQGYGNSRLGGVAGRAAAGFTSELTSAKQDSSGVSGDH